MPPGAPTDDELLAIHEALIEGCENELALACDPRVLDGVALVLLPHGGPEAQVAFGSRREVDRELRFFAVDEGPAAIGLARLGTELMQHAPAREGRLLCVVVALGRGRIHEIPWPRARPPAHDA
jgi:hypothetical protein